jgi:hypothetical protein
MKQVNIELAVRLLHALAGVSALSLRKEARLIPAINALGLQIDHSGIRAALLLLRDNGCIKNLIPLSDGDLLLTVTGTDLPQLNQFGGVIST